MRRTTAVTAAVIAALALGACGESPEDEAREDGEQMGEAMRALFDAGSIEDAQAAVGDLKKAVEELSEDTRPAVAEQVESQRDTLSDAGDALRARDTTELKAAVQELRAQGDAFRNGSDSVANEFWRGFEEGYDGDGSD